VTRGAFQAPELIATTTQGALSAGAGLRSLCHQMAAFGDVHGEGSCSSRRRRQVADLSRSRAGQLPEDLAGLTNAAASEAQFARILANSGCRVVVPLLINREITHKQLSNREFLYRSAFELGRHIIGYEIQKSWRSRLVRRENAAMPSA